MVIPAANASDASNLPLSSESEVDGDAVLADLERSRRHEELRQKMLVRKIEEKRQQVLGMRLKRETENEANERKLMEREEKSIRLQLKFLRRRSKEGKIRQMTADQRREERERLAMAREERHARIHNKVLARQLTKKRQLLATASTTTSESGSQDVSSRRGSDVRQHSSATKACKAACGSKGADSDDDGDMSFLDINFTIPSSMKYFRANTDGNARRDFNVADQFQYFIDCTAHLPMQRPMKSYNPYKLRGEAFVPLWVVASNDRLRHAVEAKLARSGPDVPMRPFLYPSAMSAEDMLSSCIYCLSLGLLGQTTGMVITCPAPNVPDREEFFVRNYGYAEVYLTRIKDVLGRGAKGLKRFAEGLKVAFVVPVPREDVRLCEEWLRNCFRRLNYIMLWSKDGKAQNQETIAFAPDLNTTMLCIYAALAVFFPCGAAHRVQAEGARARRREQEVEAEPASSKRQRF
ncbi:hypothetical protein PHYBOEH_007282 [Phytophthora boehmeriae]|uniref:Uncharacterized protein n=1 Tax=Phytophthora boehmeriae TaxID=109152 RepID=A0A8T1XCQ4_9STRA|nr:hypothetical protein PHYBOEH_007282 [Phytophthora boehmeriae]